MLSACGGGETIEAIEDEAATTSELEQVEDITPEETSELTTDPDSVDEEEVYSSELDSIAEAACDSEPSDIAQIIPPGSSFSSRGADAVVVIACAFDGEREYWSIDTTELEDEARTEFDFAVADHLRAGTFPDSDRSQSGIYRKRDGGLCAIQSEPNVAILICEAAERAQALLDE